MTDDIPSLAEAMAEIRRLQARVLFLLNRSIHQSDRDEAARLGHGLADAIMRRGTLEQPTPDEPTTITHNVPPSAPPHNE
jgi:hypothetical protein